MTLTNYGQTNQLDEVQKLIKSFEAEPDNSLIEKAQDLISDYFQNKQAYSSPLALKSKAQVTTMALVNLDQEDPFKSCEDITQSYIAALAADKNMVHRNALLNELYTSKIAIMNKGNKSYEEKNPDEAYKYYKNSLMLNELEIAHPRHATLDTSLYFTSAVFANLSDRKEEAVKIWEDLVKMNYPRPDLYDNLIRYYTENDKAADIKRITKLKEIRYPE